MVGCFDVASVGCCVGMTWGVVVGVLWSTCYLVYANGVDGLLGFCCSVVVGCCNFLGWV